MQLFYVPLLQSYLKLPAEEYKHCIKILRHKQGDKIRITDGERMFYSCEIINEQTGELKILSIEPELTPRAYSLHIAIAPTKNTERIDWMLEKLIEIGIDEITFLNCAHSERSKINMERCERIAVSAMKQSLKAKLPKINNLVNFKDFVKHSANDSSTKLIAHCETNRNREKLNKIISSRNIICCIGPEGDFSAQEILFANENGFNGISLGESRLRTETAAIGVCNFFYFSDFRELND